MKKIPWLCTLLKTVLCLDIGNFVRVFKCEKQDPAHSYFSFIPFVYDLSALLQYSFQPGIDSGVMMH